MKACRRLIVTAVAIALLGTASSFAENPILDAESGLARLKTLSGTWVNIENTDDDSQGVQFEVIAAGSAVTAVFFPGADMEMVSIFHLDGPDELVHTHYCALGNQPTMRLVKSDKPNELRFEFAGGTNFDKDKDLHVHHTTIRFLENGHVENEVEAWNDGKKANVDTFVLKRKAQPAETAAAQE